MFVTGEKIILKYTDNEEMKVVSGKVEYEDENFVQLRINVQPYRKVISKRCIKEIL